MQRKDFLKQGFKLLGFATIAPFVASCNKDNGGSSGSCDTTTPSETEGPYPTHSPASYVIKDIRSDRTGTQLTTKIKIESKGAALAGALVDIWHCDKDGNYSEYGSVSTVHFLRGRQATNTEGVAEFLTVFPGWYPGRAPHIHVHVFDATGKSLLITQIAFPQDVCDTVYTTATTFYTKGKQDTTNAKDNTFSDSASCETATLAGSVAGGYTLTHTIIVA
jgi:protocatechuate 3,4-dioxygenase beta subunit